MKKITRNLLISGAALFVIGAIIFVIGMSALKWDYTLLDATDYTACSYSQVESGHEINAIKINVDSFDVVINDGKTVSLDYYEASNSTVSVGVTDGVLEINEKQESTGWFMHGIFGFGRLDRKFVLTVTSGLPIEICGSSTSVDMRGIKTEKIDIDSTNVSILLFDCGISTLNVKSTNAHLNVHDSDLSSLDVVSTNTNISLQSSSCGMLKVESTNITVADFASELYMIALYGTNINLNMEETVSKDVFADGTNTHGELKGITVDKLNLKGINLKTNISIKGDRSEYTVITGGDKVTGTTEKIIILDGINITSELKFIS